MLRVASACRLPYAAGAEPRLWLDREILDRLEPGLHAEGAVALRPPRQVIERRAEHAVAFNAVGGERQDDPLAAALAFHMAEDRTAAVHERGFGDHLLVAPEDHV